jgi:hypothetical protein
MRNQTLDLGEAKAVVALWIEELSVSDLALPDLLQRELLDQLARAMPVVDREGSVWFEIPSLASLGLGIFRHSFHMQDAVIYVAPYAPAGLTISPAEAAVPLPAAASVKPEGLGVPFRKLHSSRSGPV